MAPGTMRADDGSDHAPDFASARVDSFVGREPDVLEVRSAIAASRLVTVGGPGGIGKTRLAREVALRIAVEFPDGERTVSLEALRSGEAVSESVIAALGLTALSTHSPDEQLAAFFADKRLLLVLDDCEHLLTWCRTFVAGLLVQAPGVHVLSTSREPLGVAGERVVTLRPLATPEIGRPIPSADELRAFGAVQLLEDRAAAVGSHFRLDQADLAAVAHLVSRLDGLPLAIELAATRLRSLSVQELADRIDDRFAMLVRGDPTARTPHQTLRAMVEWSWDLCSPGERRLWAALPVFAGGADLEAINAVIGPAEPGGPELLDAVDGLVAKSVVAADTASRRGRYTMLETIAAFGRERTAEFFPDPDDLVERHARHFVSLAERARDGFYSAEQLAWTERLRRDRANLAAAMEHLMSVEPRAALRLATALRFHWLTGPLREGQRCLDTALEATNDQDVDRLEALLASAWVAVARGQHSRAADRAEQAARLADTLDSPRWTRRSRVCVAMAAQMGGDLDVADREFTALIGELDESVDLDHLLLVTALQVLTCLELRDHERARGYFALLSDVCDRCGETWIRSYALGFYAFGAWLEGEVDEAADAAARTLQVKLEFRDTLGSAMMVGVLGAVCFRRSDVERAAEIFGLAAVLNRAVGAAAAAYGSAMNESLQSVIEQVRTHLGDERFAELFARGGQMPAAQVRALADPQNWDTPPVRPPPDLLTGREYEVATLVSTGLSNRQIADRLVLSPRTIDGHLERIFDKLGVRSRAAVSAWVVVNPETSQSVWVGGRRGDGPRPTGQV